MLVLDAALESPQQPPFEQGGDFVDAWHDLVSRSRSCRGRGHAAAPGRSPRSSGWSRTTSPGTMSAAACGSLRKSCRRSPRSPCDMPGTAASHRPFPTARRQLHSVGSKSPPASGAGGYRRGRQPHPETTRPAPGRRLGSQRPPPDAFRPPSVHSISRIWGSEGDTHLRQKRSGHGRWRMSSPTSTPLPGTGPRLRGYSSPMATPSCCPPTILPPFSIGWWHRFPTSNAFHFTQRRST